MISKEKETIYMIREALIVGASVRFVELNDGSAQLMIDQVKVTRISKPFILLNKLRQGERAKIPMVRF